MPNQAPHPRSLRRGKRRRGRGLHSIVGLAAAAALGLLAVAGLSQAAPKPAAELDGVDVHFDFDGKAEGHPERSWLGRAFVHRLASTGPYDAHPLVVFLHGTNAQLIEYRWMGGGREGDVRRIVAELMEEGAIEPVIVAGPSSIVPAAIVNARTSWPGFDLDDFVRRLESALGTRATIDRTRVVVVGHSGAGCNPKGGIAASVHGKLVPMAALAVDTCMDPEVGIELARAPSATRVVVTWQTQGWLTRPFDLFVKAFRREVSAAAGPSTYGPDRRVLDHLRVREPMPHDAMVPLTLRTWLPKLLPPAAPAEGEATPAATTTDRPPSSEPGRPPAAREIAPVEPSTSRASETGGGPRAETR